MVDGDGAEEWTGMDVGERKGREKFVTYRYIFGKFYSQLRGQLCACDGFVLFHSGAFVCNTYLAIGCTPL